MTDYSLESLVDTFNEHARESKKIAELSRKHFKENNPGQEMPEHMVATQFCLPLALASMANEILNLKAKLDDH